MKSVLGILGLLCLVLSGNTVAMAEEEVIRFCVCTNAFPRAGKTENDKLAGVDVAIAELLASKLQRRCEFHACANDTCRLRSLQSGSCDVVIGLPHESVISSEIAWTKPYSSGKFGLLTLRDRQSIRTLGELRGKRVGIVAGTVPLSPTDYEVVSFPSGEALLRGFQQAELAGALVDVDFTAW